MEPAWVQTLAGAVAGAVARAVVVPVDVIKIRMQLQHESGAAGKYHSSLHCAATMVREEGIRALWRGHVTSQALAISYSAVQFPVYEWARRKTGALAPSHAAANDFIAGAIGGTVATFTTYPFDILRTRLAAQGDPPLYNSMFQGARAILAQDGTKGLFRGMVPSLLTIVPYGGLSFMIYKGCLKLFAPVWSSSARSKWSEERVVAGGLSGAITKAILHPLDVVKKRLQVSEFEEARRQFGRTRRYSGIIDCFVLIWRHEGLGGLYKGLAPALVKAAPNTAITFLVYDGLVSAINRRRRRSADEE